VRDVATKLKEAKEMAIQDRKLEAGSVLSGTYKKERYECRVEEEDEKLAFVLSDGRRFKSASAAAGAVMGGKAVNGWLFWSLVEAEPQQTSTPKPAKSSRTMIRRLPNQKGVEDGKVRYWCNGCMKSFIAEAGEAPGACPAGHREE
jgi:hypothetical protein